MIKNKPNKVFLIICLIIFLLSTSGCEITFEPNETLFITPYGSICLENNNWYTRYLLSVKNEDLYLLETIRKVDSSEILISHNISDDLSKFYVLIGNSNSRWDPYGIGLFVFDITDPKNNTYSYNIRIDNALKTILNITDKDIVNVEITNNAITYTDRSKNETTILFDAIQPEL